MEEYILLRDKSQLSAYSHMIPKWLLESPKEEANMQFVGATDFDTPYGVAVMSSEAGTLTLQYLYIAEEFRGAGRGARFLTELLFQAYHRQEQKFQVKYIPGQYPKLERLLRGYPFSNEEEMVGSFSCTLGELAGLKHLKGGYGSIRALSECTEESLRSFYREVEARGDDLVEMPLKKKDYLADCCAVTMENGKPAGLLLVKKDGDKAVTIPYLLNLSSNIAAPVEMIRFAIQKGSLAYPPETICSFAVISETLLRLLEKMGITFVRKRQQSTLDLSYLAPYEQRVERYINGEINSI